MNAAIDVSSVQKVYKGKIHALRGIDMQVRTGEVFGLLGPNGAGKSTLVKILMTVIRPTECKGPMLGERIGHKATLARVGYLPEHHRFPEYLKGHQVIDYFGALAGTPRAERRKRIGEMLELVGMTRWADTRIKQYSKGMRQRIGIAQALVNDPDLVLMDEPTDGVDPVGRKEIRDVVRTIRDRGKTVLINSHLLSELEMVCDRVAIMVQGQMRQQGSLDDLTAPHRRYEVGFDPEALAESRAREVLVGIEDVTFEPGVVSLRSESAADVQPIIDRLRAQHIEIRSVRAFRPSLEQLFLDAVGKDSGPGAGPSLRGGVPSDNEVTKEVRS